jgi:hypothetical protein
VLCPEFEVADHRKKNLAVVGHFASCLFSRGDDLSFDGYLVTANALYDAEVELTSEDKKKLEYNVRVFKGLAAFAARPCATGGNAPRLPITPSITRGAQWIW